MKTGRLIMQNVQHICSTTITSEEYLHEQNKKSSGQLEDILVQASSKEVPAAHKPWSISTTTDTSGGKACFPNMGGQLKNLMQPMIWHVTAEISGKITSYRSSKQFTSHVQQVHLVKVTTSLRLDQVKSSINHTDLALIHKKGEIYKSTHNDTTSLMHN